MIWYDMIVVWSRHGTVSRQHIQLQLEFQVSISSSRFEFFQWRSPGRSQCQWGVLTFKDVQWNSRHSIESAKRILSIWSIHLCLSVGKSLIRPSAVPLLTSFRNLRYDEIIQAPTGALLRTLWKNVAGWQKKREGVGGNCLSRPQKKKKKLKTMIVSLARAKSPELSSILGRTTITTPVCKWMWYEKRPFIGQFLF